MADHDMHMALSGILSNLAKQYNLSAEDSFSGRAALNRSKASKVSLPGPDTIEKRSLEKEINALASRIEYLEAKAAGSQSSLPITPNEPEVSPFTSANTTPTRTPTSSNPSTRSRAGSFVTQLLSKKEGSNGAGEIPQLTEEQLGHVRSHVAQQSSQIQAQSEYIDNINIKLEQQQRATHDALGSIEYSLQEVETMKRELSKNQQINATYQKVLREIGSIITAVANGDLSKKVLINAKERDPEIATFKRTINRMVDQLQDFASQVTHLAKEVGTEGRLGGQAVLPGVDGIWAELTQNGIFVPLQNYR